MLILRATSDGVATFIATRFYDRVHIEEHVVAPELTFVLRRQIWLFSKLSRSETCAAKSGLELIPNGKVMEPGKRNNEGTHTTRDRYARIILLSVMKFANRRSLTACST